MKQSHSYYPLNSFRICVDSIENCMMGRAFSPLKKEEISFSELGELVIKMDELFDFMGYPQAFQDKRSFVTKKNQWNLYKGIPKSVLEQNAIFDKKGILITLDILVITRKNSSWQGEIYDEEGNFIHQFTGEVDLLNEISNRIQGITVESQYKANRFK